MFPVHKHSYLQCRTSVNPRIINRSVDLARENASLDQFDVINPFNRLNSEQPHIPVENCDVTRRPLAFGKWAMPKLRKELHSQDPTIMMQALNSISDLIHDPERNFEAIKLRIPDRMVDLLSHINPEIRERTCMALTTMSGLLEGKFAITKNSKMLSKLIDLIKDPELCVRLKVLDLLVTLGSTWMVVDILVDNGFLELIISLLPEESNETCMSYYLRCLEQFMYCNAKFLALEMDLFGKLLVILDRSTDALILGAALKDLSILLETAEGKELALKHKILKILFIYLKDDRVEVYQNAACAMVFATIKTEAILKAMKLPKLMERIMELAKNHHETTTQKYCFQILSNLCSQSHMRTKFIDDHYEEINKIFVNHDEDAERLKNILLHEVLFV